MWLSKYFWITCISISLSGLYAQQSEYRYAVYFKDKGLVDSPYSINNPENYLSERSLSRRVKSGVLTDTFDLPPHPGYVSAIMNSNSQFRYCGRSRWFNFLIIASPVELNELELASFSFVEKVRKIYVGTPIYLGSDAVNLPQSSVVSTAFKSESFERSLVQNRMLGMDYMLNQGYIGEGKLVVVMDGGFSQVNVNPGFTHLYNDQRLWGTWDFVSWGPVNYTGNSHGTLVLSNLAGYIPNEYVGTAPGACYFLLQTEHAPTETVMEEYNWVLGAEFADSVGADLINSSLGYNMFDQSEDNYVYAMMNGKTAVSSKAANMAARKGILVVNSAGNSGNNSWKYIGAPADADSIIAVGAVQDNRTRASFSSFGPSIDMRVKPDLSAMGRSTVVIGVNGSLSTANGTSFASPLLCGALASLWSAFPEKSAQEIRTAAISSADRASSPNFELGYGIPNMTIAYLSLSGLKGKDLEVFPNPSSKGSFQLWFSATSAGKYTLSIVNSSGSSVMKLPFMVDYTGAQLHSFVIDEMNSGVYEIILTGPKTRLRTRLVWV
jgi:serine protease AprX